MVQYYFGNKEGLVKAMIDSVFRDDQADAAAAMSTVDTGARLHRFVDGLRTISSSRSFRVFFDVLPYALRNAGLARRMARAYGSYRQIKRTGWRGEGEPSPPEQEALLGVAELMTAVVDVWPSRRPSTTTSTCVVLTPCSSSCCSARCRS